MSMKPSPGQDQASHEVLRTALLAGHVELKSDGLHLHKPDSPVYVAWDHLLPLLAMMFASLLVLLLAGLAFGLAAMTLVILLYIFGMRWWVGRQVHRRTLDAMLRNAYNWDVLWRYGGIALLHARALERPCVAPEGDWRAFARRLSGVPPVEDADAKEPQSP